MALAAALSEAAASKTHERANVHQRTPAREFSALGSAATLVLR